jgi:hypothetical protein
MTGFEPIAGTIGAVALLDPAFKFISWTYRKWRLTADFGKDYTSIEIIYHSELALLYDVLDTDVSKVQNRLNAGSTRLDDAIRNRLLLWVEQVQECDALIKKCDPSPESEEDGRLLPDDNVSSVPGKRPHRAAQQDSRLHIAGSNRPVSPLFGLGPPSTPAGSSKRSSSSERKSATPGTSTGSVSNSPPPKSKADSKRRGSKFLGVSKGLFRKKKDKDTKANEQVLVVPVKDALPPINPTIHVQDVEDASTAQIGQIGSARQSQSNLRSRIQWAIDDRNKLLELIDGLEKHSDFFNKRLNFQNYPGRNLTPEQMKRQQKQLQKYMKIGMQLRKLIQAVTNLQGSNSMAFELMLHANPFQLHSDIQLDINSTDLVGENASFHLQVTRTLATAPTPGSPNLLGSDLAAPGTSRSASETVAVLFSVAADRDFRADTVTGASSPADDRIKNFAHAMDGRHQSSSTNGGWARKLGILVDQQNPASHITLFWDMTESDTTKTLIDVLSDATERQLLRKLDHTQFRLRLGLIIASSLLHIITAGSPQEFHSGVLQYYMANEREYGSPGEKWINPYIRLRSIGHVERSKSSTSILSGGAHPVGPEVVMMRKLGILLYEVGTWEHVPGTYLDDRVQTVRLQKAELLKVVPPKYADAVHVCLEFNAQAENLANWVNDNVVSVLQDCSDGFEKQQNLFHPP